MSIFTAQTDAFWDYLNTEATYSALGLTDFRKTSGFMFAPENAAAIIDDELPAHYCKNVDLESSPVQQPAGRNELRIRLTLGICALETRELQLQSIDIVETPFEVIFDLLNLQTTIRAGLDGTGSVSRYNLGMTGIQRIPDRDQEGSVKFWNLDYFIDLFYQRKSTP